MITDIHPTTSVPTRKWSCVWQPDMGSSLYSRTNWQKAGGVRGLAWLQTGIAQTAYYGYYGNTGNAEVHIPFTDHMGNVRHYYQIKAVGSWAGSSALGQLTASFEYDAFGREVRASGTKTPAGTGPLNGWTEVPPGLTANDPWVDVLPFHFSTKFTDRESGLNYYGYRYYDPLDGRWLNRDPIGERGGALYVFTQNRPNLWFDVLGLISTERFENNEGVTSGFAEGTMKRIKTGPQAIHCGGCEFRYEGDGGEGNYPNRVGQVYGVFLAWRLSDLDCCCTSGDLHVLQIKNLEATDTFPDDYMNPATTQGWAVDGHDGTPASQASPFLDETPYAPDPSQGMMAERPGGGSSMFGADAPGFPNRQVLRETFKTCLMCGNKPLVCLTWGFSDGEGIVHPQLTCGASSESALNEAAGDWNYRSPGQKNSTRKPLSIGAGLGPTPFFEGPLQ